MAEPALLPFEWARRRTRTYDIQKPLQTLVNELIDAIAPAGSVIPTYLPDEPESGFWKMLNGQAISREDYPRLFSIFGTAYGAGDGLTTFNLPDWTGRLPYGATPEIPLGQTNEATGGISLVAENLPLIEFIINDPGHAHPVTESAHTHSTAEVATSANAATGSDVTGATSGTTGGATTGLTVGTQETGITIEPIGQETPEEVNVLPPVVGVNWLVRA